MTPALNIVARLLLALACCTAVLAGTLAAPTSATAAPAIDLTVVVQDDRATISWTSPSDPPEGWRVGRDGKDSDGDGAWSTTISAKLRSWTFNRLVRGATYRLTVTSSAGTGSVTVVAGSTPPPTPTRTTTPPDPAIEVSVVQQNDQATITWTSPSDPREGWRVGRDGKDAGGYGAWSSTISAKLRSWTFNRLVRGDTYRLTVSSSVGSGSVTIVAGSASSPTATPTVQPSPTRSTPTASVTPTVSTPQSGQGRMGWLSGVATRENGNGPDPAKYFGDWRGTPVEIGQTWPHTPDVWGINPSIRDSWAGFQGPMSLSYQPGPDWKGLQGWRSYGAIARGDMDAWWRAAAQNTRKLRAGKGTTFVSPFYEYNGDWMKWSVTRTTQGYADFRNAWARVARIWRQEFPEVRLVLPAACVRDVPAAMMPAPDTYDLVGCTIYNAWPWAENGAPAIRMLEVGRQRAESVGKPFAITEWANSANGRVAGGGGEAPAFMTAMHAWMRANAGTGAGQLVFETFFNIDGYDLDHIVLRWNGSGGSASGSQSRTAARYRELW